MTPDKLVRLIETWNAVDAAASDVETALPHQIGAAIEKLTAARRTYNKVLMAEAVAENYRWQQALAKKGA